MALVSELPIKSVVSVQEEIATTTSATIAIIIFLITEVLLSKIILSLDTKSFRRIPRKLSGSLRQDIAV